MILSTDRLDEERPIVGRRGTQDPFTNIQLRLPRRSLSEAFQKAGTVCSTTNRAEYFEQHQHGELKN